MSELIIDRIDVSPDDVKVSVTLVAGERLFIEDPQKWLGEKIGALRHKVDVDTRRKPRGAQEDDRILANNIAGATAECVIAFKLNLYPMLQFKKFLGYNLRLAGGDTIDVMWNADGVCRVYVERVLAHQRQAKEPPTFYLVLGGPPGYMEFAGWATPAEVLASPVEMDDYGPHYACRTLHPKLEILTFANGRGWR